MQRQQSRPTFTDAAQSPPRSRILAFTVVAVLAFVLGRIGHTSSHARELEEDLRAFAQEDLPSDAMSWDDALAAATDPALREADRDFAAGILHARIRAGIDALGNTSDTTPKLADRNHHRLLVIQHFAKDKAYVR